MEPVTEPSPLEDPTQCQLLGPTALIVQGLMGVFVIASLVAKRQFETRKRPWKIWVWDVGKQLVGQAVLHTLNLLISGLIAEDQHNNPCSTYFLNILIDTTIGVVILYFALRTATYLLQKHLAMEGLKSGWWRQLIPYLAAVITMKVCVLLLLTLPGISRLLLRFGQGAIGYLSPGIQVVFVLAIFPLAMNVLQFCLVDQVIKAGKPDAVIEEEGYERLPPSGSGSGSGSGSDRRRLQAGDEEDDGDGDLEAGLSRKNSGSATDLSSSLYLGYRAGGGDGMDKDRTDRLNADPRLERSSAPSPDSDMMPDSMFASVSRLSHEAQREARRSLSPKTRTSVLGAGAGGGAGPGSRVAGVVTSTDSVGLKSLRR